MNITSSVPPAAATCNALRRRPRTTQYGKRSVGAQHVAEDTVPGPEQPGGPDIAESGGLDNIQASDPENPDLASLAGCFSATPTFHTAMLCKS
ncbi:hypothetical protein GN244_ATG16550 [Phytophthora infestans]|uniref:Uncharacterized protein n=1 Tax=Phytophthora infestans TaxID=4787 RepID=A0A833S351_PHYIN|nr:hypothetical protein GN244_ATG16550 [Phytophthora infestans]KAF4131689.1 hypothetical protein GN958_ATG19163 [Phytophthora infestans]KAF4136440.1 hypothetical protein GN958_ATG14370 [Phytophthora infestans]